MTADRTPQFYVVTGASRGLGLEFVRQWLERGEHVYALARDPGASAGLEELAARFPKTLHSHACDVADERSVAEAASAIEAAWERVDVLLNNAGIGDRHGGRLADLDWQQQHHLYEVNTLGPLRVARALLPLLRRAGRAKIVNMTSLMGSIADNGSGGSWGYRLSKAALNMATRNLGHELGHEGMISVVLHPGWVKTDMGGPRAPLEAADAIASMIRTIDALAPEHNGTFVDRQGKPLPW